MCIYILELNHNNKLLFLKAYLNYFLLKFVSKTSRFAHVHNLMGKEGEREGGMEGRREGGREGGRGRGEREREGGVENPELILHK